MLAVAPLGAAGTLPRCPGGVGGVHVAGPRDAVSIPSATNTRMKFAIPLMHATVMLRIPIAVMIPGLPRRGGGAAGQSSGATGIGAVGGGG